MTRLLETIDTLAGRYALPVVPTDPLEMILWENVGYLVDDERRRRLFDLFASSVGLSAAEIDRAEDAVLLSIARQGGMRPETRVERWRGIATIVLRDCDGDLRGKLLSLPTAKARALLKAFPAIGDPGADKVLLFSGIAGRPSLDSNGLRALARLGFVTEQPSYSATYAQAIERLGKDGRQDRDWLVRAYLVLREHGKQICKRGDPICLACVLDPVCPHVAVRTL